MGQAAATGYVPDKGLPGGYQPEVEEYASVMSSKKVTTDARIRDDDGLWAGESRSAMNSITATEPWRHSSRPQSSADPPRFDADYNQAARAMDWMDDAAPHRPGLSSRQSSMDRPGELPPGRGYNYDSVGDRLGQNHLDFEPSRSGRSPAIA